MPEEKQHPGWMSAREPDFSPLAGIREKLVSQDNRLTSYPLFEVQIPHRVNHVDPRFHDCNNAICTYDYGNRHADLHEFLLTLKYRGTCSDAEIEEFKNFVKSGADNPERTFDFEDGSSVSVSYFVEVKKTIATFFTEDAARQYINLHGHNIPDAEIFVSSAWDNPEMKALMSFLATRDIDGITQSHDAQEEESTGMRP